MWTNEFKHLGAPASPIATGLLNRREMLQKMATGFGMVGLAGMLGPQMLSAADAPTHVPHFAPRAKRVIFLFLNGGPSHLDTFDPKPMLKKHEGEKPDTKLYRKTSVGGYKSSPFEFHKRGQSGIEVCDTLPHLGNVIDDCCIIRSMKTDVPNHEPALIQMHTGNVQPIRPSMGSWLLYGLGTENQNLPGYVVLRPSPKIVVGPALWSNSFLPAEFQGMSVVTSDMSVDKLIANIKNPKLNQTQQREQLDLLSKLNHQHLEKRNGDPELDGQIKAMETAFNMQKRAMDTFDISKEPEHIRKMYGDTTFARSCLLARRLVEDGVRYVTVYYTGDKNNQPWDTHTNHDSSHPKLCLDADQAAAALITDLKARGMLEDTLVIFGGEFGRTPYAELRKEGKGEVGRDHHNRAFCTLLAGGGVKGGMTYGNSDEFGMDAVENPVHVHDLHATILHLMGINHERLTYRYAGRDFRLTDVHGHVVRDIMT